jgi:hypothetical protein
MIRKKLKNYKGDRKTRKNGGGDRKDNRKMERKKGKRAYTGA